MDFKSKYWYWTKKTKSYLSSDKAKTKLNYFKTSFLAILFGLIIGLVIVAASGYNPILFLMDIFRLSLQQRKSANSFSNFDKTIVYFCVYALLGLGLSLGFKVGLFNMGGSGQALFGLMFALMYLQGKAQSKGVEISQLDKSYLIQVCFIFVLSGALISLTTGVLKVIFNIHEVASSIMLNWIAYYFLKYTSTDPNASKAVNTQWFTVGQNAWIIPLMITLIAFVIIYIFVTITKWGFKYKIVGNNKDAAKYSGISNQLYTVVVTAIQGILMSIGGLFYFFILNSNLDFNSNQIPSLGFDAISVSLIAFNNIFGILPVALLWGIFKVGIIPTIALPDFTGLDNSVSSLIFGVITYCAAIYTIFFRLNIIEKIKLKLYLIKDVYLRQTVADMKSSIRSEKIKIKKAHLDDSLENLQTKRVELEEKIKELKIWVKNNKPSAENSDSTEYDKKNIELNQLKTEHNELVNLLGTEINTIKSIIKKRIIELKDDIKSLIETRRWEYQKNSVSGIKLKCKTNITIETYAALNKINVLIADYDIYNQSVKTVLSFNKKRILKIESYIEDYQNADDSKKKYLKEKLEKLNVVNFDDIVDVKEHKSIEKLIKMGALKDYKEIISPYETSSSKTYVEFEETYNTSKKIIRDKIIDVILENKLFNQKEVENYIVQKEHVKTLLKDIDKKYNDKLKTASKEDVYNLKINKFDEVRKVCE